MAHYNANRLAGQRYCAPPRLRIWSGGRKPVARVARRLAASKFRRVRLWGALRAQKRPHGEIRLAQAISVGCTDRAGAPRSRARASMMRVLQRSSGWSIPSPASALRANALYPSRPAMPARTIARTSASATRRSLFSRHIAPRGRRPVCSMATRIGANGLTRILLLCPQRLDPRQGVVMPR